MVDFEQVSASWEGCPLFLTFICRLIWFLCGLEDLAGKNGALNISV